MDRTASVRLSAAAAVGLLAACNVSKVATSVLHHRLARQGFAQDLVAVAVGDVVCSVAVWRGGSGPPVLMLHGFGGNGTWTWEHQLEPFAAAHEVIVPDLLWFGESTCDAPATLESQATAMLGLLDHYGHATADVVGVSYGGFTTLAMQAAAPDRVGRMVIVDSPGPAFDETDRAHMLAYLGVDDPAEVFVADEVSDVRALFALSFVHPPRMPDSAVRDILDHQFSGHPDQKRALLADLEGRQAVPDQHTALLRASPALVVWGEHDPIFPLYQGTRLAGALDAPLVVVPGARHAPNVEFPDLFNPPVLAWLASPAPPGKPPTTADPSRL